MDIRLIITLAMSVAIPIAIGFGLSLAFKRLDKVRSAARGWEVRSTGYHTVRKPMLVLSVLIGLSLGSFVLRQAEFEVLERVPWNMIDVWMQAFGTATAFVILYRFMIYGVRIASERTDSSSAILLRKLLAAVFLAIAAVTILNQFGVQVGPVLASLGVAGLAAALALQDTLSNYFAGILLTIDKPIRPGDFVKIEGHEGFVESIGWRTTRIRPYAETIVVVPNSKVAGSILTNLAYPTTESRVYVPVVIEYGSDLQEVEAIAIHVAKQVQESTDGADPDFSPIVIWDKFGDSGVEFRTVLRADHFDHMGGVRGAFMKGLVDAFREKGIVMAKRAFPEGQPPK